MPDAAPLLDRLAMTERHVQQMRTIWRLGAIPKFQPRFTEMTELRSQIKAVEEQFAPQASGARGPDGAFKLFRAAKPVIGR